MPSPAPSGPSPSLVVAFTFTVEGSTWSVSASLSRIVDTLEEKKLVARRAHTADQRRVVVEVTAAGRRLFQAVAPHSEAHYREIATLVGAERLDSFYAMLDDLIARLEAKGR